jgi:hypothetical protein
MGKKNKAEEYDPGNVLPYFGAAFLTEHGEYRLSEEGRIFGRTSLEGARVALIAGIKEEDFADAKSYLESDLKNTFDNLILQKGVQPAPGLHLAVSLTDDEADKRGRNGLVTSKLQTIRHVE